MNKILFWHGAPTGRSVRCAMEVGCMKKVSKGLLLVILMGVLLAFLFLYIEDITSQLGPAVIGLVLLLAVIIMGFRKVKHDKDTNYPYRPGIEIRLENGRITTRGYAGRHPREFVHWYDGPDNVRGENIDPEDWPSGASALTSATATAAIPETSRRTSGGNDICRLNIRRGGSAPADFRSTWRTG